MKDHEIAAMVNELTRVARSYGRAQCCRMMIRKTVLKYLKRGEHSEGPFKSTAKEKRTRKTTEKL